MQSARTAVCKAPLSSYRNAGQIDLYTGAVFNPQGFHDAPPSGTVRPNPGTAVENVSNVVPHLVRNGLRQALCVVFRKQIRIEADAPPTPVRSIHAERPSTQVESHRDDRETPFEDLRTAPNPAFGRADDLPTRLCVDGHYDIRHTISDPE